MEPNFVLQSKKRKKEEDDEEDRSSMSSGADKNKKVWLHITVTTVLYNLYY